MLGYLLWRETGRPRVILERRAMGGAVFCVLEAQGEPRRIRRRVVRALRDMTLWGVRRSVVAENWPDIWREGIAEVEEDTLRQAMLPELLEWLTEQGRICLDGATVELSAPWASRAVWDAARLLGRRCRYLRLRMEGAEALREDLWRRYGIAAGGGEESTLLQVCFGAPEGMAPALLLGPGCGTRQRAAYAVAPERAATLPMDYPLTPQMIAALWQCGAVKREEIGLLSLDFHA